jgi:hypothetical protein
VDFYRDTESGKIYRIICLLQVQRSDPETIAPERVGSRDGHHSIRWENLVTA